MMRDGDDDDDDDRESELTAEELARWVAEGLAEVTAEELARWEAERLAEVTAELTDEEREWLKTPEGAAALVGRKLARDEAELQDSLRMVEEFPPEKCPESVREVLAAEVRRRLARYDARRARLEEN
jgi:hypothetical protein